jgi:hypothetical protein
MKNKYNVGELLEARSSCIIDINNFNSSSADYREEEVKAGQLFLITHYGPRNKKDISDIGYTLLCQKSATSSFWCELNDDEDLDTLMENNFNKVIK